MEEYLKSIRSNWVLITLFTYFIGYSYFLSYYFSYGITITKYINIDELIFVSIGLALKFLLIYLFSEIMIYIISLFILNMFFFLCYKPQVIRRLGQSERVQIYLDYLKKRETYGVINVMIIITSFLIMFLFAFVYKSLAIEVLFICIIIIFRRLLLLFNKYDVINDDDKIFKLISYSGITIGISFIFAIWGYKDGRNAQLGHKNNPIEFKINDLTYSTQSEGFYYVGETNTYLFLYNNPDKETLIFNKGAISEMKIPDPYPDREKLSWKTLHIELLDALFIHSQ